MEFLIMSDLHLHNHNTFGESNEKGINQRLQDGLNAVENVLELALQKKIKLVFCLGDIFENKLSIPVDVISLTLKTFRKFKDNGVTLVMLKGNHDKFFKEEDLDEEDINSLAIFRDIAVVIDSPQVLSIKDTDFFMMPFQSYKDGFLQILYKMIDEDSDNNRNKILMMHDDIGGIRYDNGTISSATIKYEQLQPKFFNFMYSGHIHFRSEFGRLIYIGSLYQKDFNEEGEIKGVYKVEIANGKIENEFIEIKSKKFKTIHAFEENIYSSDFYYDIIVDEADVQNLISNRLKGYVEHKDYRLKIQNAVIKEINLGDKTMENEFDLSVLTKNYIDNKDRVFNDVKLNKQVLIEMLTKLGVLC